MQYLVDEARAENLRKYVEQGGTLYATYMLSTVDENDLCHLGGIPGLGLKEVFGLEAEEIDTLYPHERQHADLDGGTFELADYCEVLKLKGAKVLARYTDGWYAGMPAVTENAFGRGRAIYQACRDDGSLKTAILEEWMDKLNIHSEVLGQLPHGVTCHSRTDGCSTYVFLENYLDKEAATVQLRQPMTNLLTGELAEFCTLPPYGYGIFQYEKGAKP